MEEKKKAKAPKWLMTVFVWAVTFIGILVLVVVSAAFITLFLMTMFIGFCIIFSLDAPYIQIAAILCAAVMAAILLTTWVRYFRVEKRNRTLTELARSGPQSPAPGQAQAQ